MQSLIDSFDAVSCAGSVSPYNSDDEVVWELSSSSASLVAYESADDDGDFVLLTRPHPGPCINTTAVTVEPRPADDTLPHSPASPLAPALRLETATPIPTAPASSGAAPAEPATENLPAETAVPAPVSRKQRKLERVARRGVARQRKKEAAVAANAVTKATSPEDAKQAKKERKRAARRRQKERRKQQAEMQPGAKEKLTGAKVFTKATEMYNEASLFISTFLASSVAKRDTVCRLVLLQSLIVELGLAPRESSEFPTSIRAARKFVKARVFLNVKDYIAHREEGQAALQRLLYPSKNALIKDIRRKRNAAPVKWVKQQGLDVLLVSCYHH